MPTMTVTPFAVLQEEELEQEFELDIRVSTTEITGSNADQDSGTGYYCGSFCQCSTSECNRSMCTTFYTCPC